MEIKSLRKGNFNKMKESNKIKSVCFICYRKFPDTNFENYSHFVSENGYDVTIIAYQEDGQKQIEISGRRKICRVKLPQRPASIKSQLVFIIEVIKFLRRNSYTIIHIHHTCSYFVALKIFGKPCSKYVFHSTSHPISKSRWRNKKKMIAIFLQAIFMDSIIIQSDELKEKLLGIRRLKKTKVVPVGFNKNYFYPASENHKLTLREMLGIKDGKIILLYIGTISKVRQIDRLILAFDKIVRQDRTIQMFMVGDGYGLESFKALSQQLKINENIIFTGKVEHRSMRDYICAADIGISFVPINENFTYNPPLKTFEYMACGIPTIATKTESNRKIIVDGFNGVLVSAEPEEIAESILKLINDFEKQQFIKKNASKSIAAFEFEYITKRNLLPIYQQLTA
jgi:glycosyltransferase involved in cell wall biosynthesis